MQTLVHEIAKRLNLPASEAQTAVATVLTRVRAAIETGNEAEIDGLGTFKSIDGKIVFEAAEGLEAEINRDYAGMKPVALTSTGESVGLHDSRALPGAAVTVGDGSDGPLESDLGTESVPTEEESVLIDAEPEPSSEEKKLSAEEGSTFTSPPPPKPRKTWTPEEDDVPVVEPKGDFPDMGSVVTTRPVKPIHSATPPRKKSKVPLFAGLGIAAVAIAAIIVMMGPSDGTPPTASVDESVEAATPEPSQTAVSVSNEAETTPEISEVENMASSDPVAGMASDPIENQPQEITADSPDPIDVESPEVEVEPVAVAAETQKQVESLTDVYAWIVASYPSRDEAQGRADGLNREGFTANVYEATVRGQPAFRVGIGQFSSEAEAWRNQATVPPESSDAWITKVR